MSLGPADFAGFFRAVHGHEPFPWQERLVRRLAAEDTWPDVLALPTGSGKTAAIDAAVFHLALRADEPERSAVRIVFVVDRRLVVDEALRRARRLEHALCEPQGAGKAVLDTVAARLRHLSGADGPPLLAARLRGGAPLEPAWARSPSQPTVLCSTVDQVGSRLLFRGYGVSDRMKPVHAGLLGDALFLLDEAHLSEPFLQTLAAVRSRGKAELCAVRLSATPGDTARDRLTLRDDDLENEILRSRISVPKRAALSPVASNRPESDFAAAALDIMGRLREGTLSTRAPAVGVVVNRVRLAREIYEEVRRRIEEGPRTVEDPAPEVVLMIGRSREVDRKRITRRLKPFFTGASKRAHAKPLIVVATQCLEVGVDLDLDGLVSQAAPLDSLRQRFGRLRRSGTPEAAVCRLDVAGAVIALEEDVKKGADDPVYGDRIGATWRWLQGAAVGQCVDFGIQTMDLLVEQSAGIGELVTKRAEAPVVMPAYFEMWSRTSPVPAEEPEVGLFLHGAERADADVSIVWRDDLSEADLQANVEDSQDWRVDLLEMAPPRVAETVSVPLTAVRQWLRRVSSRKAVVEDISDVPQQSVPEVPDGDRGGAPVFRWAGRESLRTGLLRSDAPGEDRLRPGDLIVAPAEYGGCDDFGWNPDYDAPVRDVADEAAVPYRARRYFVRLCESRCGEAWPALSKVLSSHEGRQIGRDLLDSLLSAVSRRGDAGRTATHDTGSLLRPLSDATGSRQSTRIHPTYGSEGRGYVLFAPAGVRVQPDGDDEEVTAAVPPATESDEFSQSFRRPVSLDDHGDRVERKARCTAAALGLPKSLASDLALAAFLHDAGKADPRFQIMLSGGASWNATDATAPVLAKSVCPYEPRSWRRAGLPKGWRHEALSVRLALAHPRFAEAQDPRLVLWLIGTHHGLGRPFFPFSDPAPRRPRPTLGVQRWELSGDDFGPESAAFDFLGDDWPRIFEDLRETYGVWGLARLEAILRLADHAASAEEREAVT